jgi:outer membrane lipoprotein LolB
MQVRHTWHTALCACLLLLAGCASQRVLQSPPADQTQAAYWHGRLSVKVFSNPMQAFSANFELTGQPDRGALVLTSPLGTTLAHLQWDEHKATLQANGTQQAYGSLQELAVRVTGADIPVASLFGWLAGQAQDAAGWQADLTELAQGRIQAHHPQAVQTELKIILDR